jgi:hypothetical protein
LTVNINEYLNIARRRGKSSFSDVANKAGAVGFVDESDPAPPSFSVFLQSDMVWPINCANADDLNLTHPDPLHGAHLPGKDLSGSVPTQRAIPWVIPLL